MSQRHIRKRRTALPALPYWRSIFASFLLLLAMIFFFEMLADPRSGELRTSKAVTPAFMLFAVVNAGVFYAEFRLRRRRPSAAGRPQRRVAIKGEGAHAS